MQRLEDRNRAGEDQRQRDRHVHPQPPGPQRPPGAREERLPGKGHGRQRDGAGNEVDHVPRRVVGPGPDGDGQDHDVHHGKARHPDPHQDVAPLPVGGGRGQGGGIELEGLIADPVERRDQVGGRHPRFRIHHHPAQRQVHPRGVDAGLRRQHPLDIGDAGRAMDGGHRQHDVAAHRVGSPDPARQRGHVAGGASAQPRLVPLSGGIRHHFTSAPA